MATKKNSILGYTILGVVFGCLFPILATTYYVSWLELSLSYSSIVKAQETQPLLWVIDTAPIFLGLFAAIAGINKAQEEKLRIISEHIQGVNERLEVYGKNLRKLTQDTDVVNANIDASFPKFTKIISEMFEADRVAIWLAEKGRSEIYNCSILCDFSIDGNQSCQNHINVENQIIDQDVLSLRSREFLELKHMPSIEESSNLSAYMGLDDHSKDHSMTVFPIINEGKVIGIVCCGFEDVDKEWKRDEVNFIDSISNLIALLLCASELSLAEDAHIAKSQFLAVISHELRTPLNIISGYNDLILKDKKKSDPHHSHYCEIRDSAKNLNDIIDDILDMGKMEVGAVELEKTPFSLSKLIDDIVEKCNEHALDKKLSFEYIVDDDVPNNLIGDELRIGQLVSNILCNALKFTEEGSVSLNVSSRRHAGGSFTVRFDVIDTGAGIKQERLMRIFDPFTQASNTLDREHGGTGLGLGICKKLTDLMKGNIGVSSTLGEGSHFWVEIPFKSSEIIANKSTPVKP